MRRAAAARKRRVEVDRVFPVVVGGSAVARDLSRVVDGTSRPGASARSSITSAAPGGRESAAALRASAVTPTPSAVLRAPARLCHVTPTSKPSREAGRRRTADSSQSRDDRYRHSTSIPSSPRTNTKMSPSTADGSWTMENRRPLRTGTAEGVVVNGAKARRRGWAGTELRLPPSLQTYPPTRRPSIT
jgi:hypothetical protein